jgi:membrane peptidoglycan carboxypeptidase
VKIVNVGPNTENWVSPEGISKHFMHSIVSAEDTRFFKHKGLDLREIWKSLKLNFDKGRYVRGASTITQQVVKLGLLSTDKTLIRKSREAIGAVLLEMQMSKEDILSWYVNLADFGSGVYGIKDAANYYFKTTPDKLTVSESIHLALVLPAPNAWSESLKQNLLTEFGRRRFKNVLNELYNNGYITKHQYETSLQTGNFGRPISTVVGEHH